MFFHTGLALVDAALEAIRALADHLDKQGSGWINEDERTFQRQLGWGHSTFRRHLKRGVDEGWWEAERRDGRVFIKRRSHKRLARRLKAPTRDFGNINPKKLGCRRELREQARRDFAIRAQRKKEEQIRFRNTAQFDGQKKHFSETRATHWFRLQESRSSPARTGRRFIRIGADESVSCVSASGLARGLSNGTTNCSPETMRRALRRVKRIAVLKEITVDEAASFPCVFFDGNKLRAVLPNVLVDEDLDGRRITTERSRAGAPWKILQRALDGNRVTTARFSFLHKEGRSPGNDELLQWVLDFGVTRFLRNTEVLTPGREQRDRAAFQRRFGSPKKETRPRRRLTKEQRDLFAIRKQIRDLEEWGEFVPPSLRQWMDSLDPKTVIPHENWPDENWPDENWPHENWPEENWSASIERPQWEWEDID